MECNVTSTKRARLGVTTVELMIGIAVGGILMAALGQLTLFTGRSVAALANYTDLDKYSRNALDQMTSKIRQADELVSFETNKLVFSYAGTNTLTYTYSAANRTLTERIGTTERTLLKGCTMLEFSIFQRNTAAGTYDQFPATMTDSAAKLIQVSWVCSRDILNTQFNTESVQSAKIVIRNQ
jgi:Tfp pilus assembly protein PilW